MSRGQVQRAVRGGLRATTGVVIVAAAAVAAVLAGTTPLPAIEREPVSLTVDTLQGAERYFVCPGSFAVLGADPGRPGVALPTGVAGVTLAGNASAQTELQREEPGGSSPAVLTVSAAEPFAAAQVQSVVTDTLRGLTAGSCAEPANEQWLLGGSTTLGVSTTLALGNPYQVPATVQLTVYDENGQVDSAQTSGVLVPAGSERIVSLNGYAPGRDRIAVRVDSTGAAVTASLGVGQVAGLDPFAVDTVTRQLAGETTLVVPGLANLSDHDHGPGDTGEVESFPVIVRALSTSGVSGSATVRALRDDGTDEVLGTIDLTGSAVGELSIDQWTGTGAIILESAVPIVGGVQGSVNEGPEHDYAWLTPAPALTADAVTPAAVTPGGQLVIANPGESEATVQIAGLGSTGSDAPAGRSVTVPAGGVTSVSAPAAVSITPSAPVHVGVRLASGSDYAAYPVLGDPARAGTLTVYPR